MDISDGTSDGPLARYYKRYSSLELLLRYARGRVRIFWGRQLFMALAFLALALVVPLPYALLAFAVTLAGDAVDCLLLAQADRLARRGMSEGALRFLTALTAFLHALTLCAAASVTVWAEIPALNPEAHNEPLFMIGLLLGSAINAGLVLPYHPWAVAAKLVTYAALPVAALAAEIFEAPAAAALYELHLAGLVVLYTSFMWFLIFVRRSFSRTRTNMLAQAQQQQELEAAYAELADQQKQAKRLALVAENANDSVMLMDREGRITWVNESFTRLTGYSFDEALGQLPGDLLNSGETDPATIQLLQDSVRDACPVRVEICNRRKDGQHVWIETSQVAMRNSDGELETLIAVERDISAAKEHARQLEEARIAAEEGARAKAEFLATMSHEIRTPMNGIIGMADLLAEADLTADDRQNVETIRSSAQALLKIINDILDLSRLEAGKFAITQEDFNLRDCIDSAADLFRPKALEKGLSMQVSYAAGLPERLHGDDGRLRQILVNLIGNAVKFTPEGKIAVRVSHAGADPCRLVVEVQDSGIGISEAQASHIFDRFTQADAATTKAFGGTGLGLTISSMLAKRMGGGISVQSELGKGSCFRLELQMAPAGEEMSTAAPALADTPPQLGPCRVLLAEDNQTNRLLIRKFLRGQPVELAEAGNGRAAVEMCKELLPDIILMDMSMPELDGIGATREIRSLPIPQPVIVALTANAFSSDRQACLDAGMDHFLAKPVKKAVLLHTLAAVLAEASKAQQRPRASA